MRTRNAYFGYWNNFGNLVDDKPGKWDSEPHEDYRMVSADCDQKRTANCKIAQGTQAKNLPQ
jgi:hypothetical protein